jgi:hypothetical protein
LAQYEIHREYLRGPRRDGAGSRKSEAFLARRLKSYPFAALEEHIFVWERLKRPVKIQLFSARNHPQRTAFRDPN